MKMDNMLTASREEIKLNMDEMKSNMHHLMTEVVQAISEKPAKALSGADITSKALSGPDLTEVGSENTGGNCIPPPQEMEIDPSRGHKRNIEEENSSKENQSQDSRSKKRRPKNIDLTNKEVIIQEDIAVLVNKSNTATKEKTQEVADKSEKQLKSQPPIIIKNMVENWDKLNKDLSDNIGNKFNIHYTKGGATRITTYSEVDYRKTREILAKDDNIKFHAYATASSKPLKFVIRPIPYGWEEESISKALDQMGHPPKKVIRLRKKIVKNNKTIEAPTPLMVVVLANNKENKAFANVKQICNVKLDKIEPFRGSLAPIQCYNCLNFNHVAPGCHHDSRCNRCADPHNTRDCTKSREEFEPKCANCSGKHAASYAGCPVYQRILQARKTSRLTKNKTYAEAASPKKDEKPAPSQKEELKSLIDYMKNLITTVQDKYGQ